jgi:Holliday junction resolvase RusA-like endonuclease
MPSPSRMKQMAAERQRARFGRVIDPGLERELAASQIRVVQPDPALSAPIAAEREGDVLRVRIETAPRTKKDHGRRVWAPKQKRVVHVPSPAYEKYRGEVVAALQPLAHRLQLPLPDQPYNIAARFFVDRYGMDADLDGLMAGLFDALENAGVVTDDWYFRTPNGTEVFAAADSLPPRVEVLITPIPTSLPNQEQT